MRHVTLTGLDPTVLTWCHFGLADSTSEFPISNHICIKIGLDTLFHNIVMAVL